VSIKEQAMQYATNMKVGVVTGAGTVSAGAGTWFDVIPDDIGKLASLVGILLSSLLIFFHVQKIRKSALEISKTRLEIEILKAREAERQSMIASQASSERLPN
jgi:hypothetical protein